MCAIVSADKSLGLLRPLPSPNTTCLSYYRPHHTHRLYAFDWQGRHATANEGGVYAGVGVILTIDVGFVSDFVRMVQMSSYACSFVQTSLELVNKSLSVLKHYSDEKK